MQTLSDKPKKKATKAKKPSAPKKEYVYALEPLPEKTKNVWESESEVGETLAALIKLSGFKNVLELGTLEGKTTDAMLQALGESATLTTVDIDDLRSETFKEICSFDTRVTFIKGDSIEVCKSLFGKAKFDLIFVDTVHTFEHALPEFKAIEPLMGHGCVLAYHDSIKFEGVDKLINYAKAFRYNAVTLQTPEYNGLTLLQR